ncbi:hypothetical protein VTN96DRAFT_1499 [Rasamsonia emersonii]
MSVALIMIDEPEYKIDKLYALGSRSTVVRLSPSAGDMASSGGAVIGPPRSTGRRERGADDELHPAAPADWPALRQLNALVILRRSKP